MPDRVFLIDGMGTLTVRAAYGRKARLATMRRCQQLGFRCTVERAKRSPKLSWSRGTEVPRDYTFQV